MGQNWNKLALAIAIVLSSFTANSQQPATSSSTPPAATEDKIKPGVLIQAEMISVLDAKKNHAGDIFEARVWSDVWGQSKIILPHDTKITGRVLDAQPRTKANPESKLTITLDKAVLKDGSELPLRGVVQGAELPAAAVNASQNTSTFSTARASGNSTTQDSHGDPGDRSFGGRQIQLKKNPISPFGPSGVPIPDMTAQSDSSGTLTSFTSTKNNVRIQSHATINVYITRTAE